jgi:hypothetical protein
MDAKAENHDGPTSRKLIKSPLMKTAQQKTADLVERFDG